MIKLIEDTISWAIIFLYGGLVFITILLDILRQLGWWK